MPILRHNNCLTTYSLIYNSLLPHSISAASTGDQWPESQLFTNYKNNICFSAKKLKEDLKISPKRQKFVQKNVQFKTQTNLLFYNQFLRVRLLTSQIRCKVRNEQACELII